MATYPPSAPVSAHCTGSPMLAVVATAFIAMKFYFLKQRIADSSMVIIQNLRPTSFSSLEEAQQEPGFNDDINQSMTDDDRRQAPVVAT